MKILHKAFQTGNDLLNKDKKQKGNSFMHGLKEWVTSPGGLATLVGFALLAWYVHHSTKEK